MKTLLLIFTLLFSTVMFSSTSFADCEEVSEDKNWSIIYTGTVTGYRDSNGKRGDDFEGCDFGRDLILDYSKKVTCDTYDYTYSYMPDIEIYSNGYSLKACIEDTLYDVSR
jgi:hypothetical protein